eukprot:TRINITY_DN5572_c0_g2_i1.p1 TRINITY_DN5572_c0_g2~~TRINITY_DN5572_c0_g2_i1.p1  ORF type:complete len:276 (+),score=34.89 TRINITY_DN5572_c0_g2_i1:43-870(+)
MAATCRQPCKVEYDEQASRARRFWTARDRVAKKQSKTQTGLQSLRTFDKSLQAQQQEQLPAQRKITREELPPMPFGPPPTLVLVQRCIEFPVGPPPDRPVRQVEKSQQVPDEIPEGVKEPRQRIADEPPGDVMRQTATGCAWPTCPAPTRAVRGAMAVTRRNRSEKADYSGVCGGKHTAMSELNSANCSTVAEYKTDWDYRELKEKVGRLQRTSLPPTTTLTTPLTRSAREWPLTNNDLRLHFWDEFEKELADTLAEFEDHPAVQSMLKAAVSGS